MWRDLLTAYDGQSITYDQIGNPLIYRNGIRFTWEHGRQMSSVLSNGVPTYYTYNADGTRHSKTTSTNVEKTTTYYYVEGVLYAVESPDYTVVFQFDDTGRPYGFRLLRNDLPGYESRLYYKYNLQGDVVGIYDISGNEVVTYTYDPWGKLLSAEGVDVLIDANPLLYRGYVYDKETGLYYCNSRYYDPETGRWINADSVMSDVGGDIRGYNLFAYCMNNPVNMSDPTGNWPSWATKLVAAVAVVAVVAAVAAITVATAGAGTAAAVIAVGAAKGAAIGLVTGAAIGAGTAAVNHRVSTGSWEGADKAALEGAGDGALSGAVTGAITGAAGSALKVGQAAKAWDSSSKGGSWTNMSDHYKRHVLQEGKKSMTRNVITYTNDAKSLWSSSNGVGKLMSSGSLRLKGSGVGGFYSQTGLIRSFFYQ